MVRVCGLCEVQSLGAGAVALRRDNSAEPGVVCAVFPEAIQEVKAGRLCVQSRCCLEAAVTVRVHTRVCGSVHDYVCKVRG